MRLYRISKSKYAKDTSGEGSKLYGGRWNLKGIPAIYTADSAANAVLETIVHSPLKIVPKKRSIAVFNLPDDAETKTLEISNLPPNWRTFPAPIELAEIGTEWIQNKGVLALRVPSVILPDNEGWNFLLNPLHSKFKAIKIIEIFPYDFDQRLFEPQS